MKRYIFGYILYILPFISFSQQFRRVDVNYTWFYSPDSVGKEWSQFYELKGQSRGYYQWLNNGDVFMGGSLGGGILKPLKTPPKNIKTIPSFFWGHKLIGIYEREDFPLGAYLLIYVNDNGGALISYENFGHLIIHYASGVKVNPFKEKNIKLEKGITSVSPSGM